MGKKICIVPKVRRETDMSKTGEHNEREVERHPAHFFFSLFSLHVTQKAMWVNWTIPLFFPAGTRFSPTWSSLFFYVLFHSCPS